MRYKLTVLLFHWQLYIHRKPIADSNNIFVCFRVYSVFLVTLDLALEEIKPPETLYHGTVEKFIVAIQLSGLQKMNRQHVHLSQSKETATSVGSRRGKPIILVVKAAKMHRAGFKFYRSENGVWLTDSVPWQYIERESV